MTYASGPTEGSIDQCDCSIETFTWNGTEFSCVIDCSLDTYAEGREPLVEDECLCRDNFVFNSISLQCEADCANLNYSAGAGATVDVCECEVGFEWNSTLFECTIVCGGDNFGIERVEGTIDECTCDSNKDWNVTLQACVINCSIPYATGREEGNI